MPASKYAIAPEPPVDKQHVERSFPMYVMSVKDVLLLNALKPHEEMMAAGKLVEWTAGMAATLFCSHTWLSFTHPDPEGVKLVLLKDMLTDICAGKLKVTTN